LTTTTTPTIATRTIAIPSNTKMTSEEKPIEA